MTTEKYCKADLHVYLRTFSGIKDYDLNNVIETTYNKLGKDGIISLTNCEDERYEKTTLLPRHFRKEDLGNALYIPEKNIWIVKGQAVNAKTEEKNVQFLVLGLKRNRYIESGYGFNGCGFKHGLMSLEDAIKQAKDENGICIMSNPFGKLGVAPYVRENPKLLEYFDGIVIFSGENIWIPGINPRNANERAQDYFNELFNELRQEGHKMGALSVSDAHSFEEIGRSYTLLPRLNRDEIRNSDDLVAKLRESIKNSPVTKNAFHMIPSRIRALTHVAKLAAFIYSPPQLKKRIANSTI